MNKLKINKEDIFYPYLKLWNGGLNLLDKCYIWSVNKDNPATDFILFFILPPLLLLFLLTGTILFPLRGLDLLVDRIIITWLDRISDRWQVTGTIISIISLIPLSLFLPGALYQRKVRARKQKREWDEEVMSHLDVRIKENNINFIPKKTILKHKL